MTVMKMRMKTYQRSWRNRLRHSWVSCYINICIATDKCTERLLKDWTSPIYVFFKPTPSIEYIKERHVHVFECSAVHWMGKGNGRHVRRYLDTGDAKSTSNLHKHAKICWGDEAVAADDNTKDIRAAREVLGNNKTLDSLIGWYNLYTLKHSYFRILHTSHSDPTPI